MAPFFQRLGFCGLVATFAVVSAACTKFQVGSTSEPVNTCGETPELARSCGVDNPASSHCGPNGEDNCCETLCVPGGTFLRSYDGDQFSNDTNPATVSPFYMDKFEVTVGRFRLFVESNFDPQDMALGHPSGKLRWDDVWEGAVATNATDFVAELNARCAGTNSSVHFNWTPTAESRESEAQPMNCVNWAEAYAFCLWEGGRLPTEAEWNFAAAGGSEQRVYPWSSPPSDTTISSEHAGYGCDINTCQVGEMLKIPGSRLASRDSSRWGHADLAGNLFEWMLDAVVWTPDETTSSTPDTFLNPCIDCVDERALADVAPNHRALRGGTWWYDPNSNEPPRNASNDPKDLVKVGVQLSLRYNLVGPGIGFRCVHDVKQP